MTKNILEKEREENGSKNIVFSSILFVDNNGKVTLTKSYAESSSVDDDNSCRKDDYYYAEKVAKIMHKEQMYGSRPYQHHLLSVVNVLKRFGFDPNGNHYDKGLCWDLLTAAWLHDIVEDTPLTQAQISQRFNARVSLLVNAVTNPDSGSREEKASAVYPKIKSTPHALTLKLADRIANLEHSILNNIKYFNMYKKEWSEFSRRYEPLIDDENIDMWILLKKLILKDD